MSSPVAAPYPLEIDSKIGVIKVDNGPPAEVFLLQDGRVVDAASADEVQHCWHSWMDFFLFLQGTEEDL